MMMQLFRSLVTVIVVGTIAVMIFSLRSELAVAKAKAKGGESKSVIAEMQGYTPYAHEMKSRISGLMVAIRKFAAALRK